jgi:hypothetical protein
MVASKSETATLPSVDKWQTTIRVEEIRREIGNIQTANRIYKAHVAHSLTEIAEHEKRQTRLREIMVELKVLSGDSAG